MEKNKTLLEFFSSFLFASGFSLRNKEKMRSRRQEEEEEEGAGLGSGGGVAVSVCSSDQILTQKPEAAETRLKERASVCLLPAGMKEEECAEGADEDPGKA